jgi:TPR repeat protein
MLVSGIKMIKLKIFITFLVTFSNLLFNISVGYPRINFLSMGDSPYSNEEFYLIDKELKNIPGNTNFVIYIGSKIDAEAVDEADCDEKNYKDLSNLLKQSHVPVFIIPGAKVYWKCKNQIERNPLWDQYFFEFEKHWELGFLVNRQKRQKENFSFFIDNALFIGINLFEKRNRDSVKFNKLMRNNISWIKESLKQHQDKAKSLVIFAHDFSGLIDKSFPYETCGNLQLKYWETHKHYKYFDDQFVHLAKEFKKPILYIHDNSQCWTHDRPFKEAQNIERIVVDKVRKSPLVQITLGDGKFFIDQRKNKRVNLFIEEASIGDVWSQYFLALEYLKLKDYKNAKKWLTKASNKKFPPAQVKLGEILLNSKDETKEKKYAEAFELFQSALQKRSHKNINSELQINRNTKPISYQNKIIQFHNQILEDSVFFAYFFQGVMYSNKFGVPQNHQKALEYFQKASEGNIGAAYSNIAIMYFNGMGVKKDFKEARNWCVKGALAGVNDCNFMIGTFYLNGQGVQRDYKEAAKWFKPIGGYAPVAYNLGVLYFNGLGVTKDVGTALKYFKHAAKKGSSEAIKFLKDLSKKNK